jgi:hypothetical protein
VLSARQFPDQVRPCEAPIEDHRARNGTTWHYLPNGRAVGIPYRALVTAEIDNVLVAKRCFSTTHDAHASVRSMAQCMAMGRATGVAAALTVLADINADKVDTNLLRSRLRKEKSGHRRTKR